MKPKPHTELSVEIVTLDTVKKITPRWWQQGEGCKDCVAPAERLLLNEGAKTKVNAH